VSSGPILLDLGFGHFIISKSRSVWVREMVMCIFFFAPTCVKLSYTCNLICPRFQYRTFLSILLDARYDPFAGGSMRLWLENLSFLGYFLSYTIEFPKLDKIE
jgi:hypothetical protein